LAALADLDVAHERNLDRLQTTAMDPTLKEAMIRSLQERHQQMRERHLQQLAVLQERIRIVMGQAVPPGQGHLTDRTSATKPSYVPEHRPLYNLFRRQEEPHLHCAVPEDRPVPGFIGQDSWAFCGTLSERTNTPRGFDEHAATGARFNGFYLFQVLND
jgi:hypothetical protein